MIPGIKATALIALVSALVSGVGFGYLGHRLQAGKVAEAREETANLRADYEARARQASDDYRAMEAAWQRENVRIVGAYRGELEQVEAALADERARGADLGRRLLLASANLASRDRAAEVVGAARAAESASFAERERELAAAVTEYDRACRLDAVQLAALIERVK